MNDLKDLAIAAHGGLDRVAIENESGVYLIGEDGAVLPEPLVVSIDLDTVRFH